MSLFKEKRTSELTIYYKLGACRKNVDIRHSTYVDDNISEDIRAKDVWLDFITWYENEETPVLHLDYKDMFEPIYRDEIASYSIQCFPS